MPKYATQYVAYTTSTSRRTALTAYMVTDATRQAEIVEAIMTGSGDLAPADVQHRAELAGSTFAATGVSTTIVPIPWHPNAGQAALGNFGANISTEPTAYSAVVPVTYGFNQRGGMRWAVPQGEGFRVANSGTTEKGAGFSVISSVAGEVDANIHFWQGN